MSFAKAIISGFVGACTLSLLNESARQFIDDAPRLDVLGKRAIALPLMKTGQTPPKDNELYWISMAGDLAVNTLYYSLAGLGDRRKTFRNGALLGLAAGTGTVVLPKHLGLGTEPSGRTRRTKLLTVAWYLAGGLATATAHRALSETRRTGR
jgi:hypothetical protein